MEVGDISHFSKEKLKQAQINTSFSYAIGALEEAELMTLMMTGGSSKSLNTGLLFLLKQN